MLEIMPAPDKISPMFFARLHRILCCGLLAVLSGTTLTLIAEPTGPTLQFGYAPGTAPTNLISRFMYFVPLISPEPVTMLISPGNSQGARLLTFNCRTNRSSFVTKCDFEFVGSGSLQNIFDHTEVIQQNMKDLQAGETLTKQLSAISVTGDGRCIVEISGAWINGAPRADKVQLHFDAHGKTSPVTICLQDLIYRDGKVQIKNELIARINTLTFQRGTGIPKMEVSLDSIKRSDAGDSRWQNFVGELKGSVANLFIPPLKIQAEGQQAMLDFGQALTTQQLEFTFPLATRLKVDSTPKSAATK
jgi:hypothetical protein